MTLVVDPFESPTHQYYIGAIWTISLQRQQH